MSNTKIIQLIPTPVHNPLLGLDTEGNVWARAFKDGEAYWYMYLPHDRKRMPADKTTK